MFVNGRNQGVTLDIILMKHHDIILGYLWLMKYNPQFNWRTGQIFIDYDDVLSGDDESNLENKRSPIPTPKDSESKDQHKDTTDTSSPPKGTRHKHQKGKKTQLRRTIRYVQ